MTGVEREAPMPVLQGNNAVTGSGVCAAGGGMCVAGGGVCAAAEWRARGS